jgi:hypothetical protein
MDGFPILFRFWPGTRAICQQLPTIPATTAMFEANGFKLAEHRRVQQQTAASFNEFAERTRLRADTALALISDSEFQEGQIAIEAAAAAANLRISQICECTISQSANLRMEFL